MLKKSVGTNGLKVMLDISKLEALQKKLNIRYAARVGVLGAKAEGRKETIKSKSGKHIKGSKSSSMTNAEIGLIHEKGSLSKHIPRRSFLEMPLTTQLPKFMSKLGKKLMATISEENLKSSYKELAIIGEGIVLRAFGSSGFGSWAPNAPSTIASKGSSRPLIDTAQLRQSISSKVVTK